MKINYVRFKYTARVAKSDTGDILPVYPATVVISNRPRLEKGPALRLPVKFVDFLPVINPTPEALRLITANSSGWVDVCAADGTPIANSLSMGGNIAKVKYVKNNFACLDALTPNSPLPDPYNRLFVHQSTAYNGNLPRLPVGGVVAYFPFVFQGDAFVSLDFCETFETIPTPLLPGSEADDPVINPPDQPSFLVYKNTPVFQAPGGPKVDVIDKDTIVEVQNESKGYSQIGSKRWVRSTDLH